MAAPALDTAARALARPRASSGPALLVVVLVGLAAGASLTVGPGGISPAGVVHALAGSGDDADRYLVWQLRVPRTLLAVVVGLALGLAGALVQALTRNPLADPGLLGVSSGAALFVAGGVALLDLARVASFVAPALLGALTVTALVYLVGAAGRGPVDPVRLTLAGVALGAVFQGLTWTLLLSDVVALDRLRLWSAGSVAARGYDALLPVLPLVLGGAAIAVLVARTLDATALGDDVARALGEPVTRTRVLVVVAVTLLAGGATAAAGPILFVGLAVPHVARLLVGTDQRRVLALSALLGPLAMLVADVAARLLLWPGEIPVGVVAAFVGAPVLIALARRGGGARW